MEDITSYITLHSKPGASLGVIFEQDAPTSLLSIE